jgi:hypothetical protein
VNHVTKSGKKKAVKLSNSCSTYLHFYIWYNTFPTTTALLNKFVVSAYTIRALYVKLNRHGLWIEHGYYDVTLKKRAGEKSMFRHCNCNAITYTGKITTFNRRAKRIFFSLHWNGTETPPYITEIFLCQSLGVTPQESHLLSQDIVEGVSFSYSPVT